MIHWALHWGQGAVRQTDLSVMALEDQHSSVFWSKDSKSDRVSLWVTVDVEYVERKRLEKESFH